MLAEVSANGDVAVRGDPDHPANFGRLCSKGAALAETIDLDDRLLFPEVHGVRSDWDSALDLVAGKFNETIRTHGPDSVAFYVSGQLLTEDYYVANKLMKGFIGSANIDTNSRLCMASSVAGHKRAFGSDTVPGCYEDLELADLVVLVGSNLAWCHPVLYQRIAAAKEKRPGMKVVLIDPRRTATADIADLHLPIKPDGDVPLFLGLLRYLARSRSIKRSYIKRHTTGFKEALRVQPTRSTSTPSCGARGCRAATLEKFFALFAADGEDRHRLQPGRQPVVVRHRQGQRHHQLPSGDRPHRQARHGAVLRHRPAQRHGRPRGRRPRQHARRAHEHRGRRASRSRAALLELADDRDQAGPQGGRHVPRRRRRAHQGAVDHGDQPVVSMPEAEHVEAAIRACPFVVVSDVTAATDTARLPTCSCPRRRGARRAARSPIRSAASRASAAFCRHRATPVPTGGSSARSPAAWAMTAPLLMPSRQRSSPSTRRCRASRTAARATSTSAPLAGMDGAEYEELEPVQWPRTSAIAAPARMFADGRFFTPDAQGALRRSAPRP